MRNKNQLTFWEHIDELRECIIRICVVFVLCSVIAFFFKEEIFSIVFAPRGKDFITYKLMVDLNELLNYSTTIKCDEIKLINTGLASQFMIHFKLAFQVGFLLSFPYLLFQSIKFVSPALHKQEKKYVISISICSCIMFALGTLLAYYIIFPFTYQFLSTYQVSELVENLISLQSYIDNFISITLFCGIAFNIPIFAWILAKFGVINAPMMKEYRRHCIITILIIAAIITPTSDIFTLALVSTPLLLLYEISIFIVSRTKKIL